MDPFVIVSFGKKTFRTKVIRHNLNPIFNERLIFQVMKPEKNYQVSFKIYDRDKMSSNDFVAQCLLPIGDLIKAAPEPDSETGLYKLPEPWKDPDAGRPKAKRQDSKLSRLGILSRSSSSTNLAKKGNGKNGGTSSGATTPSLSSSTLELTRSLSSTSLSDATGATSAPTSSPTPEDKDLKAYTIPLKMRGTKWEDKHNPELVIKAKYVPYAALRQQFWRCLLSEYDVDDVGRLSRVELITMLDSLGSTLSEKTIDGFFQRFQESSAERPVGKESQEITIDQAVICLEDQLCKQSKGSVAKELTPTDSMNPSTITLPEKESTVSNPSDLTLSQPEPENGNHSGLTDPDEKGEEHVIVITECPLCHQPRMNKRSEVDIVTHIATCASQDWRQVDHFVMGGFVTSDQAHRKWYTKV